MSDIDFKGTEGILLGNIRGGIIRLVEKKGGFGSSFSISSG